MKRLTICLLFLFCAGCAQPSPAEFARGDVDQKQFDRDDYECERDARNIRGDNCAQMDMFETCMKSKGYAPIPDSAHKGMCTQLF